MLENVTIASLVRTEKSKTGEKENEWWMYFVSYL